MYKEKCNAIGMENSESIKNSNSVEFHAVIEKQELVFCF